MLKLVRSRFWQKLISLPLGLSLTTSAMAITTPRNPDIVEECEILIAGAGLAGAATAYEALLMGKTVCLTDITDWVGGQISSQGTSALDERTTQRQELFFPQGYLQLRSRIEKFYGELVTAVEEGNLTPTPSKAVGWIIKRRPKPKKPRPPKPNTTLANFSDFIGSYR